MDEELRGDAQELYLPPSAPREEEGRREMAFGVGNQSLAPNPWRMPFYSEAQALLLPHRAALSHDAPELVTTHVQKAFALIGTKASHWNAPVATRCKPVW